MILGKLLVSITRISDGTTVVYPEDFTVHDDSKEDWTDWQSMAVFMWSEGNYSCNCNRFLFFYRGLNWSEEKIKEIEPEGDCGVFEKFRVNWIKNEAGEVIYQEV